MTEIKKPNSTKKVYGTFGSFGRMKIRRIYELPADKPLLQVFAKNSASVMFGPENTKWAGTIDERERLHRQIYSSVSRLPDAEKIAILETGKLWSSFFKTWDDKPWLGWQTDNPESLKKFDDYRKYSVPADRVEELRTSATHHSLRFEGYEATKGDTKKLFEALGSKYSLIQNKPNDPKLYHDISQEANVSLASTSMFIGHFKTEKYMLSIDASELTETHLLTAHRLLMEYDQRNKAGEYRKDLCMADEIPLTIYPYPQEVPQNIKLLFENLSKWKASLHPFVAIMRFYSTLLHIHPFDDGNGRVGRLMTSTLMRKEGFLAPVVQDFDRDKYLHSLFRAHSNVDFDGSTFLSNPQPKRYLDGMFVNIYNKYLELENQ